MRDFGVGFGAGLLAVAGLTTRSLGLVVSLGSLWSAVIHWALPTLWASGAMRWSLLLALASSWGALGLGLWAYGLSDVPLVDMLCIGLYGIGLALAHSRRPSTIAFPVLRRRPWALLKRRSIQALGRDTKIALQWNSLFWASWGILFRPVVLYTVSAKSSASLNIRASAAFSWMTLVIGWVSLLTWDLGWTLLEMDKAQIIPWGKEDDKDASVTQIQTLLDTLVSLSPTSQTRSIKDSQKYTRNRILFTLFHMHKCHLQALFDDVDETPTLWARLSSFYLHSIDSLTDSLDVSKDSVSKMDSSSSNRLSTQSKMASHGRSLEGHGILRQRKEPVSSKIWSYLSGNTFPQSAPGAANKFEGRGLDVEAETLSGPPLPSLLRSGHTTPLPSTTQSTTKDSVSKAATIKQFFEFSPLDRLLKSLFSSSSKQEQDRSDLLMGDFQAHLWTIRSKHCSQ